VNLGAWLHPLEQTQEFLTSVQSMAGTAMSLPTEQLQAIFKALSSFRRAAAGEWRGSRLDGAARVVSILQCYAAILQVRTVKGLGFRDTAGQL